jgi:phosphatidylinositol alpha-1,6-mannosyltransferase
VTRADVVIGVSRYTCELARGVGAQDGKIRRINNGVDVPDSLAPRREGRPTILTIARLEDRYKGHDVMLRALPLVRAQIPDVHWVVVGDGPLRQVLEPLAHGLGVNGAVHFAGSVSDVERDAWLGRADVFAMVSRLPAGGFAGEGFGIVYLEANAHGVPVVAGNVGGATDAVVHGQTGLLVDPTDHVAVADALVRLLRDRELARRLGTAGRERARCYTWSKVAERVEDVLLEMMS